MEIKIHIFGRIFSLCIGNKTPWFWQASWLCLTEEWMQNGCVVHANSIYQSPKKLGGKWYWK